MKQRLVSVDIMVGIAMTLVVVAHHLLTFMPDWYFHFYYCIYIFHMPLFIFLSGFLMRYSYKGWMGVEGYWRYVWRKFVKFAPPYVAIGSLVIGLNFLTGKLQVSEVGTQFINLLVSPKDSDSVFLWYIYMLLMLYVISPPLFKLSKGKLYALFCVAAVAGNVLHLGGVICMDYFVKYLAYFLLGVIVAVDIEWFCTIKYAHLFGVVSFAVFGILEWQCFYRYSFWNEVFIPYLSLPIAYSLSCLINKSQLVTKVFETIARHCFTIYLLHLMFIQAFAMVAGRFCEMMSTGVAVAYLMVSSVLSITLSIMVDILWKKAKFRLAG